MPIKAILISFGLASCLAFAGQADSTLWTEISIPRTIQTNQQIVTTPNGWQCFDEITSIDPPKELHALRDVTIFCGHPKEAEFREHDIDLGSKKESIFVWKVSSIPKKDYWVNCSYNNTRLSLCMPIPHSAAEVRITINRQVPNAPRILKVEFR